MSARGDFTQLLARWVDGDAVALSELLPLVYTELRELASRQFRSERANHTLQPTALVHEAYVRLVRQDPGQVANRTHFFALAAKAMRQTLVDHARRQNADKRVGKREQVTLSGIPSADGAGAVGDVNLLDLDGALEELAALHPRSVQVVELRYFGGLTLGQTAKVLEISVPTVTRDWQAARIWLHDRLAGDDASAAPNPG